MDELEDMEQSLKEEYDKFLDFCSISLKGENPKFLDLIKSRYAACDDRFRCSGEMVKLLEKTQKNMAMEESRKFVHLKEFLTKLKINTAAKWKKKKQKRKHSSDSETETTHQAKAPKLKDCSVVVTKFPDDDLALYACDEAIDAGEETNSAELRVNKTCSISDGDVSGALSIVVADDERVNLLKEELGSGIDCSNDSPVSQFSEPSFSRKVDVFGKEAVEQRNSISHSRSMSPHIPFSTRGISSRRPVVYVDIDGEEDFYDDDRIEIGSMDSNDTDSHLASALLVASESEKWQTENDTNPDNQTSQDESILSGVTNEPPKKKSTSIVDIKLSNSPDVLVILASSSCHGFKDFSDIKNMNNQTEQQEITDHSLTLCNEKDSAHNAHLDTISHDTGPPSAIEDTENTSNSSFEVVLAETPTSETEDGSSLLSLIPSIDTPEAASFQNTVIIETEDELCDIGKDSIPCEGAVHETQKDDQKENTLASEIIQENQKSVQNLDALTSEVKESKKGIQNLDALTSEVKESKKGIQKPDTLTSEVKESKKGIQKPYTLTCEVKESQTSVPNLDTLMSEVVQENQKGVHNLDTLMSEVKDSQKGVQKLDTLTCREKDTLKSIQNLDTLTSEVNDIQNGVQNLNTLVPEVKSSVVDKLTKRVPLLSVSKYIPSSSDSSGTKPFSSSFSKQEKAAQKPSSSSETKVVPSSLEARPLETGDSADEFQKESTDHILDKNQLKQKRRVAKLEHLLESLRDEIEKCQDAEMTLDDLDDDNAAYIYEDKLKRKFVAVWNKLCEVTERTVTTGRPTEKRVRYSGTRYQEINRRIEKFLNKKKVFPDFHDIKSIVKLTDKKCNLNLSAMMLNDIAREAFVDIGEMLQTRRHQDFIATFGTRQTDVLRGSADPYLTDPEFRRKVDSNRQVAKCNLDNVIAKFTKLQKERFYGEEEEEPDEESEEENDNKKAEHRSLDKQEKHKDTESTTAVEDVTTDSTEADMAEASDNDDMTSCSKPGTSDASRQPLRYNPSVLRLGRSAYLLSPDKGKATASSSRLLGADDLVSVDQQLDASSSADGPELAALGGQDDGSSCNTDSVIVIEESPAKSQQELRKSSFEAKLNPFSLDKQEINIKSADAEKGNQSVEGVPVTEKRGPNIKFTARKPLHPESGLSSESFEKPKFDNKEDVAKSLSSVYEIFDDDEDEDQSSDSTSDQDADDKCVDDDVDEIVMIIDRSESECDTVSTRDPSPISVVSLSSESFDDMADNWEKEDSPAAEATTSALPVSTPVEFVSSPKASNRHSKKDENWEKRKFMEAMGIGVSENSASGSVGLAEEVLQEKNKDTLSCQTVEVGAISAASQIHTFTGVDITAKDEQQKKPTAGSPLQARHTSPVNRISQDSDDCIIICDTPKPTNGIVDTEETNHRTTVVESLQSVKKALDFQLSTGKCSAARNDQAALFRLPANETESRNSTEIHQLSEIEKQAFGTDKKIPAIEEDLSLEIFGRAATRTDFPQATAEHSDSGIAEKLHSLNNLLQNIYGSTSDNCMLPDVSTDANNHGNLPKGTSGKTGTTEVNMPETGNGTGTSNSPGLQNDDVCVIDGDMSNDSSQTGIHIMDVCSIGAELCDNGDDRSYDAVSAPNSCEYFGKAALPPSGALQSPAAARNKTVAASVESGVSDSYLQDPVLSHPDSSFCVDMKSTDGKYNSTLSTVTNVEPSRLFQKPVGSVTDGDSRESCIEIIDEFEEDACVNSSTSAFPEPSKIFKQNSDRLFCKPQNKVADTAANQNSAKGAKVRQSGASEKKLICSPNVKIKSSPAKEDMIREDTSDPITIDLCESSSVSVICLEYTNTETASITRQEINVGNVQEKHAVEDKAGNYSSQTDISIVESFEQADFGNTSVETPRDKHKNTSIETAKDKHENTNILTPKDKHENTSTETPKDKHENTSIETSRDKHEITSIEAPKDEIQNTSIEAHKDEIQNTSIEAPKDKIENTSNEAPKDKIENTSNETTNNNRNVSRDRTLEDLHRGTCSEDGNPLVEINQDSVVCESAGNRQEYVHNEKMGKTGESVHIDGVGNNEGNVHKDGHYREHVHTDKGNIEGNAATVGSNGNSVQRNDEEHFHINRDGNNDGSVPSSGPNKVTVSSNSLENSPSAGSDVEMGNDDDVGENVQSKRAENDEGIVHSNSMECGEENVGSSSIDGECVPSVSNKKLVHNSNAGINEENVQAINVENNEEDVLDGAGINEEDVLDGAGINKENVLGGAGINDENVLDGAEINDENVLDGAGMNEENVQAGNVENNEENVLGGNVENNEDNVQAGNVENNEDNVQTGNVENNEDCVLVDRTMTSEENVQIDSAGTIVRATSAENNEGIILVNVAGIIEENVQADGNIKTAVQADDAKNNEANVQINNVGNSKENICVSVGHNVVDGSSDTEKIHACSKVMDRAGEDRNSKLCDNIAESGNSSFCDSHGTASVGQPQDISVQTAQPKDKSVVEEMVQIVQNEQKRMNQEDIVQSSGDLSNKTSPGLEVEGESGDDKSVDLLSTGSPSGDVGLELEENGDSLKTPSETVKETRSMAELTGLGTDGGMESISGENDLDADGEDKCTEEKDLSADNEDRHTGQEDLGANGGNRQALEEKDLSADNEDRHTGQEDLGANGGNRQALEQKDLKANRGRQAEEEGDLNAKCGNGHILEQEDLDGDGHTPKQLDVYSNSGDGHTSEQSDLDRASGGGYTELKDLNKDHESEHAPKNSELNTDGEDSVGDAEESLPILLDFQSVRSLDIDVTEVEECGNNGSENDTATAITSDITEVTESTSCITEITSNNSESTSNATEKLTEFTVSDKMKDSSNTRRHVERLEEVGKRQDEEEATVTNDVDSELASLREGQDNEDSINNKRKSKPDAEKDDSGKCVESKSLDDEEEIKIIEELSSVKGVRHSDHSKEEDRKLVDQLLLDMGLKTVKETTVAVGSSPDTVLADEPGKSSDELEKAETAPSIPGPDDVAEKAPPEKESSFLPISSMCHASVFSVECESVESESVESEEVDEGELSPSTLCVQDPVSVELQPKIKSRKRPYNDSDLELQSVKTEEKNLEKPDSVVSSHASTSFIDVEMLPPFKKPKAVDYNLINDVISSVLAEFPAGRGAGKFPSSKVKQPRPTSSKTTEVPEVVIDDDDDDVVIMEESASEAVKPSIFPVALHENRNHGSSAAFRQQSSVTAFRQQSSLGRGMPSSANQPSFRKQHQSVHAHRNPNHIPQNVPSTSFQPHSQISSSNGKRFSFATKNRSSAFMRTKNSLTPTVTAGQNRSLSGERAPISQSDRAVPGQRIPTSQSLPRLAPRVPIPSIQADRTSEPTRTQPKFVPGASANFANKRFQSPTSGYIRSPTAGHIRSPTAGNIRTHTMGHIRSPVGQVHSPAPDHSGSTFRPHMPSMSLSRKRTYVSSMTPSPSSSSPSGVALRGSGRTPSYPKQPPSGALHNTGRHPSQNPVPPQRLQPQQFQRGSKSNTANSRVKQQGVAGRVEIILGDSDDEGDFNNTSSGPRIVSVASLSTSANSDTSSQNPSRVPGSRTAAPSHRPSKDVIVIPD